MYVTSINAWRPFRAASVFARHLVLGASLCLPLPATASAWTAQQLKDPLSGTPYSRLTEPALGEFAVTGIAAGVPKLGLECDPGDDGRHFLSVDIDFPVAIARENFVEVEYRFDSNPSVTVLGRLLRPWQRLDLMTHSFEFARSMLNASQVQLQFMLRGRGSPYLTFDLSDHAPLKEFLSACYPDIGMAPQQVAPRVAEFLLQEGTDGVRAVQAAMQGLDLYDGSVDGRRSPALFLALQHYAAEHKADEVVSGEFAHVTARRLLHILRDDPRIPAEIRRRL